MLECKHGCGHKHEHRGSMNLHETKHCKKLVGTNSKPSGDVCCGNEDYRLLDPSSNRENLAKQDGWKEVCESCGTLR
jgi:hypothetical protein